MANRIGPCAICGGERDRPKQGYCRSCANLYKRAYRMICGREARRRDAARAAAHYLLRKGDLKRRPCEVCGSTAGVEMHHDDYDRVADVRWLCHEHHAGEPKDRVIAEHARGLAADYARETGNTII